MQTKGETQYTANANKDRHNLKLTSEHRGKTKQSNSKRMGELWKKKLSKCHFITKAGLNNTADSRQLKIACICYPSVHHLGIIKLSSINSLNAVFLLSVDCDNNWATNQYNRKKKKKTFLNINSRYECNPVVKQSYPAGAVSLLAVSCSTWKGSAKKNKEWKRPLETEKKLV